MPEFMICYAKQSFCFCVRATEYNPGYSIPPILLATFDATG